MILLYVKNMPRPTTKAELLTAANARFGKLFALIDTMPENEQTAVFCFDMEKAGKEAHWKRDKNVRDVLIHLYEWHQLFLSWVKANKNGENKPFLPEPYNWKTYGEMNIESWEKHQSTTYDNAVTMIQESHRKVVALIESLSD